MKKNSLQYRCTFKSYLHKQQIRKYNYIVYPITYHFHYCILIISLTSTSGFPIVHVFPEEAVAEVKRQAMLELQKAVAASEAKTNELLAAERAKMQAQLEQATQRARDDAMRALNQQQDNSEVRVVTIYIKLTIEPGVYDKQYSKKRFQ